MKLVKERLRKLEAVKKQDEIERGQPLTIPGVFYSPLSLHGAALFLFYPYRSSRDRALGDHGKDSDWRRFLLKKIGHSRAGADANHPRGSSIHRFQ